MTSPALVSETRTLVDLYHENHWLPIGGYRTYVRCHVALGWVSATIIVAGLAGSVRRPAE